MKKVIIILFLGTFIFTLLPISTSLAKDGDGTSTTTPITSSSEAERAASTAAMAGIGRITMEGVIFATALVLMAAGVSSGIDSSDGNGGHGGHGGHGH